MDDYERSTAVDTMRDNAEPGVVHDGGLEPALHELERLLRIVPLTPLETELAGTVIRLTRLAAAGADERGGAVVRRLPNLWDLTEREKEVLELIVEGRTNRDAARELHISPRTIEVHRASLKSKMGAETTSALVTKVFLAAKEEPSSGFGDLVASLGAMLQSRLLDTIEQGPPPSGRRKLKLNN